MFTLGAPFSSLQTRLQYWPIQLSTQPLPGSYAILVTTTSPEQRRSGNRTTKSIHTIVQAGYEWIFQS